MGYCLVWGFSFHSFWKFTGSGGSRRVQSYNGSTPLRLQDAGESLLAKSFLERFPDWHWRHTSLRWVFSPFGAPWSSEPLEAALPSCSVSPTDVGTCVYLLRLVFLTFLLILWGSLCCWVCCRCCLWMFGFVPSDLVGGEGASGIFKNQVSHSHLPRFSIFLFNKFPRSF